jgi:hypothetical protein
MASYIARLLHLNIFVVFGCDSAKQRRVTFLESEHKEKQNPEVRSQKPE